MMKRVFTATALLLLTLPAQAGLFKLTNRQYGTAPDNLHAQIDALFDSLENNVNNNLPNADTSTYLAGIARSTLVSGAGVGVDYSSPFKVFVTGANVGTGLDLGNTSLNDLLNGTVKADKIAGFSAQAGVFLGVNLAAFTGGKGSDAKSLGWGDLGRFKAYLGYYSHDFSQSSLTLNFKSFSLIGQYRIFAPASVGWGAAKWGGLDVAAGLRYSSVNFQIAQAVNESSTQTLDDPPTNPQMTANFNGHVTVGANTALTVLPIDVSSSVRILYLLNFFGGLGMDLSFGSATSTSGLSGPVTITSNPDVLGTVTADASLDLGGSQRPSFISPRVFGGFGIELGVFNLNFALTKLLTASTLGLNVGLRAFW